ncbi:hypothetical protein J6590_039111 [Homalodisca vitripennis]|nr:hypothetical protein J6590_039111 [Homalodisca vitripennis]
MTVLPKNLSRNDNPLADPNSSRRYKGRASVPRCAPGLLICTFRTTLITDSVTKVPKNKSAESLSAELSEFRMKRILTTKLYTVLMDATIIKHFNITEAIRQFQVAYPGVEPPSNTTISKWKNLLLETGRCLEDRLLMQTVPGEDAEECCRSRGSGTTKPQSNDALSEEVDDSNYCPVNGTEPRIDPTPRSRSPDSIYCRGSLLDGTLGL